MERGKLNDGHLAVNKRRGQKALMLYNASSNSDLLDCRAWCETRQASLFGAVGCASSNGHLNARRTACLSLIRLQGCALLTSAHNGSRETKV